MGTNDSYEVANKNNDKVPMASCVIQFANKQALKKPLLVLFDSGSSSTWFSAKALPPGCVPNKVDPLSSSTLAGQMTSNLEVKLDRLTFPEFFKTRVVDSVNTRVFHTECRYDAIIGRDLLNDMGLVLDFKQNKMSWDECHVPMREFPVEASVKTMNKDTSSCFVDREPTLAERLYYDAIEADLEDDNTLPTCDMTDDGSLNDEFDDFDEGFDHAVDDGYQEEGVPVEESVPAGKSKSIGVSRYEDTDIDKVCRSATHLSQVQQNDLNSVLSKYTKLFDNQLGKYTDETIHLDLREDAVPVQTRAYTVPHNHRAVFKAELDRLCKIGVLEPASRSEWISGTFIIPKKLLPGEETPRVRWVSDFHGLN